MYSRATLLEIDTTRIGLADAVALFASPPGREWYEVAYLEAPSVTAV